MKVIIDSYRGGTDTGNNINNQYEKNLLLNLSKYLEEELNNKGINTELVRTSDISLTDDERNSIINEIKDPEDIIIQNRLSEDNEFDIIYPLRNNDILASLIAKNLEEKGLIVDKYYQRRLPTNTMLDYYSIIRNTNPNETLILEYKDLNNYQETIDIIANTLSTYIKKSNIYIVKKGDSLYQIAQKFNTTVDKLKKLNNLNNNLLSIGQEIIIPKKNTISEETKTNYYIVKKGDSLYQIAKNNNLTVEELKKINNINNNILSIGQKLILPTENNNESKPTITYTVQKGDSLYQIANKYNTTVENLKKINNLINSNLSIGQILKVPSEEKGYIVYTVKKGDSLYQIAKIYNTTTNEIKSINNLTSNLLSIGQQLKIPRWIFYIYLNIF